MIDGDDVHLTEAALDARDHQDHGLLDYDVDDERHERNRRMVGAFARMHPHYPLWTPTTAPREDGDPF